MSFRFRRRLNLMPGVTLNLGKRGISTSLGVRGAHLTLGGHGARTTIGVPGTGLSASEYHRYGAAGRAKSASPGFLANLLGYAVTVLFFGWLFGWL